MCAKVQHRNFNIQILWRQWKIIHGIGYWNATVAVWMLLAAKFPSFSTQSIVLAPQVSFLSVLPLATSSPSHLPPSLFSNGWFPIIQYFFNINTSLWSQHWSNHVLHRNSPKWYTLMWWKIILRSNQWFKENNSSLAFTIHI